MNEWILRIITMVLSVMTPELRENMTSFVKNMEAAAKKTPNPWDDIFVGLLKSLLGIKD
ncbi:hypothetical protein ES703_26024 [subsurface metagenome]